MDKEKQQEFANRLSQLQFDSSEEEIEQIDNDFWQLIEKE